jgi:transposase
MGRSVVARMVVGSDRGSQPVLLPVDARDLLSADHPAWAFMSIVEELDLAGFHAAYRADGRGRPPFDPAMMVALLLYCASKRIRSARAVERACRDDLGARVICGNRVVDHATVDRFRRTHGAALRGLLSQSIRLCDAAGLVDVGLVAGDGTKAAANAAKDATLDEARLRGRIQRLTGLVEHREAAWRAAVAADEAAQPGLFDLDGCPQPGPDAAAGAGKAWPDLLRARRALQVHQAALDHLLAHPGADYTDWQARLERDTARVQRCRQHIQDVHAELDAAAARRAERQAAGERIPGARPVPVDQHTHLRQARTALDTAIARAQRTAAHPPSAGTVNITDPTSRIMPGKHGGYHQAHNVQATACASQVILAIGRHDSPNDTHALTGLLAATRTNLDTAAITTGIGVAVFDNGYASDHNFTADLPVATLLVAVTGQATGANPTPRSSQPGWQTMTHRLTEPTNQAHYKRRAAIIEPVFAQLFNHFGHNLNLHGEHVDTELHLWATSHNLGKLIRRRTRQHTHPPG